MTSPGILRKEFFDDLFYICNKYSIFCILKFVHYRHFFQFYGNLAGHNAFVLFLKISAMPQILSVNLFIHWFSQLKAKASTLLPGFDSPHLPPTPSLTPRCPLPQRTGCSLCPARLRTDSSISAPGRGEERGQLLWCGVLTVSFSLACVNQASPTCCQGYCKWQCQPRHCGCIKYRLWGGQLDDPDSPSLNYFLKISIKVKAWNSKIP